jgi:hypothetical protein
VVKHFYPEAYDDLRVERSWQDARTTAQKAYLPKFLRRIRQFPVDCKSSFLEYCWVP